MSSWIRRPFARVAGVLVLLAMVSAGLPTGQVHAHAGGDHDHEHHRVAAVAVAGDAAPRHDDGAHDHSAHDDGRHDDDDPVPAAPGGVVLHAHDGGTPVSALPVLPGPIAGAPVSLAPNARSAAPTSPSAARTPPHRPPIG